MGIFITLSLIHENYGRSTYRSSKKRSRQLVIKEEEENPVVVVVFPRIWITVK